MSCVHGSACHDALPSEIWRQRGRLAWKTRPLLWQRRVLHAMWSLVRGRTVWCAWPRGKRVGGGSWHMGMLTTDALPSEILHIWRQRGRLVRQMTAHCCDGGVSCMPCGPRWADGVVCLCGPCGKRVGCVTRHQIRAFAMNQCCVLFSLPRLESPRPDLHAPVHARPFDGSGPLCSGDLVLGRPPCTQGGWCMPAELLQRENFELPRLSKF